MNRIENLALSSSLAICFIVIGGTLSANRPTAEMKPGHGLTSRQNGSFVYLSPPH